MKISIDEKFFEHLLNCMCNQKYLPTLGQPMSSREQEHQKVIDKAYQDARSMWLKNPTVTAVER